MSWLPRHPFGFGVGFIATRHRGAPALGAPAPFVMRAVRAAGPEGRCGSPVGWRRAMTTDACTPSEADLRAEIAKLELELKGVTEKARLSQEALDSARSQEPTEPKKKPRRRGGKKKNKMSDAIQEARQEVQRCPRNAQCRLDLARGTRARINSERATPSVGGQDLDPDLWKGLAEAEAREGHGREKY